MKLNKKQKNIIKWILIIGGIIVLILIIKNPNTFSIVGGPSGSSPLGGGGLG